MYTKDTVHNIVPITDTTLQKLDTYVGLLLKWQRAYNLISKHSIAHIWHRHIADSMQIYPMIAKKHTAVADLGSGGGLPAIVVAILAQDENIGCNLHITTIESNSKKAVFLQHCIRQCALHASVINDRIEKVHHRHFDAVICRALCNVTALIEYMIHLQCTHGVLLKGDSVDDEIRYAQNHHTFSVQKTPSITHPTASIISITL